ncbi:MAG: MBL fold metallo-hydrolase [Sandaracinaceae bacterium]|nr:MBL fold metallo-hydrolase [Sandaracinaceae bacterium]
MRVTILASGSGGNATLVQAGGCRILVDAGVGPEVVRERMTGVLGRALDVDAIVTTHAHGDHVGKLAACARAFGARAYVTEATHRRIPALAGVRTTIYGYAAAFDVGPVRVHPMPVPHDAPQVALVFEHGGARAALVTDLGSVPKALARHLAGCQLVMLESNHDPDMLWRGPYPEPLKRRVASRLGHLSNAQASALLAELGPETTDVVLMHLSQRNNSPLLALSTAKAALNGRKVRLRAASQDVPLDLEVRATASARRRDHEAQLALPL